MMKGSTNAQPMAQQGFGGGLDFSRIASGRYLNILNALFSQPFMQPFAQSSMGTGSKGTMQPSNSNYASGGNVKPENTSSVEDDIEAAIRLARMIGRLTEKL